MYVFELTQPGVWLEGIADDEERRDAESLLRLLFDCVEDAAVSLALFESSQGSTMSRLDERREAWDFDRERERAISDQLESQLPADLSPEERWAAYDSIREQASAQAKREAWGAGRFPESYLNRLPFIHAKSCLYAIDTLQKSLSLLSEMTSAPQAVKDALDLLDAAFPGVKHVRDSAHHAEDRVQGKARKVKIDPKPVANSLIHAPNGGALIVNVLNNNRYGGTPSLMAPTVRLKSAQHRWLRLQMLYSASWTPTRGVAPRSTCRGSSRSLLTSIHRRS